MAVDPLRESLAAAAKDDAARDARRAVCFALSVGFERAGQALRTCGHLVGPQRVDGTSPFGNGDDGLVALGYLGETGAALITGAAELIERGNLYAAAALNRQLVEVEYLTWAFAEDQDEAADWLRSTRQERMNRWQPKHLRDRSRGRFRAKDYWEHCEVGGHPTPKGLRALLAGDAATTAEITMAETANHGTSAWQYVKSAVAIHCQNHQLEPTALISGESAEAVEAAAAQWRQTDRLAVLWHERPSNS